MDLSISLAFIAGGLNLFGFYTYVRYVHEKSIHPSTSTWFIWAIISVFASVNYIAMTGDWIKGIGSISDSVACIIIFVMFTTNHNFKKPDPWNTITLVFGIFAAFVWWYSASATYGNIAYQLALIVSIIPTLRNTIKYNSEKPLPWMILSSSYLLIIVVVLMRWQGQYMDLASPINMFISHTIITYMSMKKNKEKKLLLYLLENKE